MICTYYLAMARFIYATQSGGTRLGGVEKLLWAQKGDTDQVGMLQEEWVYRARYCHRLCSLVSARWTREGGYLRPDLAPTL